MRNRTRRWLFRCVLVGIVAVCAAIGGELATRALWQPPDLLLQLRSTGAFRGPEPGTFEPLPGFVGRFLTRRPQHLPPSADFAPRELEIRTNSLGMRGPDLAARLPGERRILFGGDSLTFGHALAFEESYPARTAARLSRPDRPVVACNAAVPGYGFVATCKRLLRLLEPTAADALVAAYFLGNDFSDDVYQRTVAVYAGGAFTGAAATLVDSSWRARLCVRSSLWMLLESQILQRWPEHSLAAQCRFTDDQLQRLQTWPPLPQTVAGLFLDADIDHEFQPGRGGAVRTWLADLAEPLRLLAGVAANRPVLVVVLPSQYQVDDELRGRVLAETGLAPALLTKGTAQRRIVELCATMGLPCFDATPALTAGGTPGEMFDRDHVHISALGSEVVARALADMLAPLLK